jgi:hypothetical protein
MDWLRLELKDLEDDEAGIAFPDTHSHNTAVTLSGVVYARIVEIINGYTLTITPAFAGTVTCTGANHNLGDVYNNTAGPTLIIGNAAGLVDTGTSDVPTLRKLMMNRLETDPVTGKMIVYDDDDATVLLEGDIYQDVAATQPYDGEGIDRRDRLVEP